MKKYNLVIVENDERYMTNLMNYISQKYSHRFNTVCFTDLKYVKEFIRKNEKVDMILINPDFLADNMAEFEDKVVIILTEDIENYKDYQCIKKYQSVDKICNDLIKAYEINIKFKENNIMQDSTSVFTFYSPIGGIGTSTLAISTAYAVAEKNKKTLYINLESIQSTGVFFNDTIKSKYNFSDLIISIKNRNNNFIDILNSSIKQFKTSKLYYINAADSILDIEELTSEDIKELIENIEKSNIFDFVIFDVPSALNTKYYNLFQKSANVFVAIGQDRRSNYKIDTLLRQLDNTENFLFVVNKFNKTKERLLPKLVAVNSKPIIQTINFEEDIEGIYNIDECFHLSSIFKEKIEGIVNNNILMY